MPAYPSLYLLFAFMIPVSFICPDIQFPVQPAPISYLSAHCPTAFSSTLSTRPCPEFPPLTMATPHVLMFGANGGTGRAITKVMLEKSWRVTAVIRQPAQKEGILRLGAHGKLQPEVLVQDLQHLNQQDADRIIEEVRPNYIVFAAGMLAPHAFPPFFLSFHHLIFPLLF